MGFTPWRERDEPATGRFDGVPAHLAGPLDDWIASTLDDDMATRLALLMRITLPRSLVPASALRSQADGDAEVTLTVIDLMLKNRRLEGWYASRSIPESAIDDLEGLLSMGGSLWTVSVSRDGLARRASPELSALLRDTNSSMSPATSYLRTAWSSVYGRDPNPTLSVAESVKAVEDAAGRVIAPKAKRFQLNKVAQDLRAQKRQFRAVLSPDEDSGCDPLEVVASMMEWLIRANSARHGTPSEEPVAHTNAEAEMAVQIAIVLVEWLEHGYIRRIASDDSA